MKQISVLLIEDNIGDKILIEEELKESVLFDTSITWVKSYSEFCIAIQKNTFDVILLDLTLPDESGEELIKLVLANVQFKIPVIILTGIDNMDLSLKSLDLGADDYLQKDTIQSSILEKSILYGIQRHTISLKLKDSETWFSTLFDKNPLPIIVYEAKSDKIIAVNDAVISKYGYSKEAFLKMKIADLRATQQEIERSSMVDLFNVLPSKLYEGIYIHKTKKNKLIYMEVVRKSLRVNNKTIRILLANDITEKLEILSKINLQDKSLQEISWIQSHVVRSPIVRILGIIDLMKNEPSLSKKDLDFFLESIFNSATELDVVTRIITNKTKLNT